MIEGWMWGKWHRWNELIVKWYQTQITSIHSENSSEITFKVSELNAQSQNTEAQNAQAQKNNVTKYLN